MRCLWQSIAWSGRKNTLQHLQAGNCFHSRQPGSQSGTKRRDKKSQRPHLGAVAAAKGRPGRAGRVAARRILRVGAAALAGRLVIADLELSGRRTLSALALVVLHLCRRLVHCGLRRGRRRALPRCRQRARLLCASRTRRQSRWPGARRCSAPAGGARTLGVAHVQHVLLLLRALKALLRLLEALVLVALRAIAGLHRRVVGVLKVLGARAGRCSLPPAAERAGAAGGSGAGRTSSVRLPSSPSSDGSDSITSSLHARAHAHGGAPISDKGSH